MYTLKPLSMPYLCVLTIAFEDCLDGFSRSDEMRVVTQNEALIFLLKFIDKTCSFTSFKGLYF